MTNATEIPTPIKHHALRSQVVAAYATMLERGLITGSAGNVSVRLDGGMLITPTRVHPYELHPDGLAECDFGGAVSIGAPSLEWRLHAEIYLHRRDVQAIVHTHSPYAIARSFDASRLEVLTEERRYFGLDHIEVAAFAPAGSGELALAACRALGRQPGVLLARHGALAVGHDPREAVELATTIEHQAQISLLLSSQARSPKRAPAVGRRGSGVAFGPSSGW
jgi:L-fuculose-phosphate aldolase